MSKDNVEYILKEEEKGTFDNLEYNNVKIWPFVRRFLLMKVSRANMNSTKANVIKSLKSKDNRYLKKLLKKSLKNIFAKYDYMLFTEANRLRKYDGILYDRLSSGVFDYIDYKKTITFMGIKNNSNYEMNLVNSSQEEQIGKVFLENLIDKIVLVIIKIRRILKISKMKYDIVDKALQQVDCSNIDYANDTEKLYISYRLYKIILKLYSPKIIFSSNLRVEIYKAAQELSIPTVEFEHGVIHSAPPYDYRSCISKDFLPNYFLSYGKQEKKFYQDNCNFDENSIVPVGNFLLNKIVKSNLKVDINTKEYKFVFCVSLQHTILNEMVDYILKLSKHYSNYLFILVPRGDNEFVKIDPIYKNVLMKKEYSLYEILKVSNFHITGYSGSAFEAPCFNVPNIFINFYNLSSKFYRDYINKEVYNILIEPNESMDLLLQEDSLAKIQNIKNHDYYYEEDFGLNLKKFMKKML